MRNFILLILFVALALSFSNQLVAQKDKGTSITIGIVDSQTILAQLPETKEAEAKLLGVQKALNDSIQKIQENFQKRVESYMKQKNMMPLEQQQKEEDAFRAEEQSILQYRETKFQDLSKKRDEFLEPIRKIVKDAIDAVAKDEKITLILDKQVAIYSDDKLDITFSVLDRIKRGRK